MVSRLFSSESLTSSGRTPGTSATIFTASLSSNTSQTGIQDEVRAPFSWAWNGHELKASSRMELRRRRLVIDSRGRRFTLTDMVRPPHQRVGLGYSPAALQPARDRVKQPACRGGGGICRQIGRGGAEAGSPPPRGLHE